MKVLLAFLANTLANFIIGLMVAKFLGPEEYGKFALAFSIALVVQTALYDWLRLSATRFYSERTRVEEPTVRATLDLSYIVVTLFLLFSTSLYALVGPALDFESELILLGLLTATANGLFDYSTALARSRFHDHTFGRLIFAKNVLSLLFIGGGAFLFKSAGVALAGGVVSLLGSVMLTRSALADGVEMKEARRDMAERLVAYSAPIVAAHLLYQAMPLAARSIIASVYGFAETGQFALAYDLGIRAVQALGSALDVLLFQIAVATHEEQGVDEAKQQIARNMGVVVAFLLPACAGLWFVMPSLEQLIVPGQYRGPFGHYLGLLLPGLFSMGVILFGVNPVFQIDKKTTPLIVAAMAAVGVGLGLLTALPWGADASNLAIAQAGAYVAALVATIYFALRTQPVWPSFWEIFAAIVGTGVMTLALHPMRAMAPGLVTLFAQLFVGIAVYGAMTLVFDIAGLRGVAVNWLRSVRVRAP